MKKQLFNPILPGWEYIPDGEPHIFEDRLYLFGSHDRFGGDNYCLNDYVCWSAPVSDHSDWCYHGKIYDICDDPFNKNGEYCGYAPDVCKGEDGRYYLYYALSHHGSVSVAVSDTPAGKYSFLGHIKTDEGRVYGLKKGDCYCFDPGILVDSDGTIHLYLGFSPTADMPDLAKEYADWLNDGAYHIELEKDMLTIKGSPALVIPGSVSAKGTSFEGHAFFEAPSIRYVEGKYCFIYSSQLYNELCYAFSASPVGPFFYGGALVSNCDIGYNGNRSKLNYDGNNHGSIEKVGEDYFIFYHRHTNRTPYSRQACAEKLNMDKNGNFLQAEITSCGLNIEPLIAKGEFSANIACNLWGKDGELSDEISPYLTQSGIDRENLDDQYIANMQSGSFAGFKYFNFSGCEKLYIKLRAFGSGKVLVYTDLSADACCEAGIGESHTDSWFEAKGTLTKGKHPLYFSYAGEGKIEFLGFRFE